MRVYADTSFLLKLLVEEPGTAAAIALYRSMGRPKVYYLPLHALEVENAIRQKVFYQRQTLPKSQRKSITRERDAALRMLSKFLHRAAFLETSVDFESAIDIARQLSLTQTERLGCRGFDLLHVAFAVSLRCEAFLTCDHNQAAVGRAAGITIVGQPDS